MVAARNAGCPYTLPVVSAGIQVVGYLFAYGTTAELRGIASEGSVAGSEKYKCQPETGEPLIDGYPLFSGLPHPVKELTDEEIGDFEYQIIRACGLSTANSDINPIGLRQIIKAILKKAQEK